MEWKKVAQLDEQGYFIGTVDIQESPLEPGTYIYPPNCVDTLPPAFDPTQYRAKWDGTGYWLELISASEADASSNISPEQELDMLKRSKIEQVVETVNYILHMYAYDYSDPEKLSWPKQEKEAIELTQNPNAPAPFLRHLAAIREIDVMVLKDRILFNVENYAYLSGILIGLQQKYTDYINSFTVENIEELRNFKPNFPI